MKQKHGTNLCSFKNNIRNPANGYKYSRCLICTIRDIHIIQRKICVDDFAYKCVQFNFYNNTVFEEFFKKFHLFVIQLYVGLIDSHALASLFINIKTHNLTRIDLQYLIKTLQLDVRYTYELLYIKFGPPTNELKIIDFNSQKLDMELLTIYINIVCDTDHATDSRYIEKNYTLIKYRITEEKVERRGPEICTKSYPTQTSLSTMNTTIQYIPDSTNSQILTKQTLTEQITISTNIITYITSSVLALTTTTVTFIQSESTILTTIINTPEVLTTETSLITTTTTLFKPQTIFTTSHKSSLIIQSITNTIFYTNSSTDLASSSTQLPSQTNLFLLSLLLILFILIIYVAMISLWIYFKHHYSKRNMIDQNYNIMSNIDTWNTSISPTLSSDKQKNTIIISNKIA